MALQLKQSLSLSQQLIMTPQLQQAIKLLQLSRLELLETITQELETNPLLDEQMSEDTEEEKDYKEETTQTEEDEPAQEVTIEENVNEDLDWETYLSEYNTGWAEVPYEVKEAPSFENINTGKTNLHSHLMWQLGLNDLDERQIEIGIHIIGNIDDDGYLKISIEELSLSTGYSEEEILETLKIIQTFDPVGVAARDTRECLLIQTRFENMGGTIVEKRLANQKIMVDTGCIVAFESTIDYDIQRAGNLKSMIFGGEGLFLATLQGTGRIWLQSLPFSRLADRILEFAPSQEGKDMGEGSIVDGAIKILQQ